MDTCTQFSLFSSIVAGTTAGLAVAVVLGINNWRGRRCERRDQIRYLRDLLLQGMTKIHHGKELPPFTPGGDPITADQVRHMHYAAMRRVLDATLATRASAIKPEEIIDLNEALRLLDWIIASASGHIPAKEHYYETFDALSDLKWLGIKELLDRLSATEPGA